MATVTIKNMPDELYQIIKKMAKSQHRSLNNELIFRIEQSLRFNPVSPETIRENAREFRKKLRGELSPEEIEKAINEGRP